MTFIQKQPPYGTTDLNADVNASILTITPATARSSFAEGTMVNALYALDTDTDGIRIPTYLVERKKRIIIIKDSILKAFCHDSTGKLLPV